VSARVVVLAGPSGAGKSRLAERLGLPVLRLDDFYKDGDDPSLPRIGSGPNAGIVDWDHPDSWILDDALAALTALCETGVAEVPVYDIPLNGRVGTQRLTLEATPGADALFVAEGIFAQEIVRPLRAAGHLAGAYCVTQAPIVTFWRRLTRDLRERRKPPLVLLRRGLALMRGQRSVVEDCVAKGCVRATPAQAYDAIRALAPRPAAPALPWGRALVQPDHVSCGATSVVVARMLRDPAYAEATLPRFGATVQELHRTFRGWPRQWGTAFWSVAHHLGELEGRRYTLRPAYVGARTAFDRLHRGAAAGQLSALYVGTATLPRHVVLVVGVDGSDLRIFDPGDGRLHTITRDAFASSRLDVGGWHKPWTVVSPCSVD
jgi:uridine kinase